MSGDRGGYVHTAPTTGQTRAEAVVLRWVLAAVTAGMVVLVTALMILWVDGRHHRAIRNGRPLPAHTVTGTPHPTPGPPAVPGGQERMLRLGDAPANYLPPPPWLPAATIDQIGKAWQTWASATG